MLLVSQGWRSKRSFFTSSPKRALVPVYGAVFRALEQGPTRSLEDQWRANSD
jgi:hypothetical protein